MSSSYVRAFISGFLINTFSPFTFFFWIGAAVFVRMQDAHPCWYYAGVMLALAVGDLSKAWLAPKLILWLKEKYVYWIQVVAGVLIACTGVYVVILGILE
jgi:threonine/homoserine/homoserine lactone efflux protein